jgi:heterodisulfide reductase subunit A-like polyferredoxin
MSQTQSRMVWCTERRPGNANAYGRGETMDKLTTKEINIIGNEIANGVEYYDSVIPDSEEKLQVWAGLKVDYLRAKASGKPTKIPNELDDDGWYLAGASQTPEEIEAEIAAEELKAQEEAGYTERGQD